MAYAKEWISITITCTH